MSFTTCRTFALRTLSTVSSSGIGTVPEAIFVFSLDSNFSSSSKPIQTPTKRASDRFTSFFARSTSASTTTTFRLVSPSASLSAAAFSAASNIPSFDNPKRPDASISKSSSLCSNLSNLIPSDMRSSKIGFTKRGSSSSSLFTNVDLPVPSGPLTRRTVTRPSSSPGRDASSAEISTPLFFASAAMRTAIAALPGIRSAELSEMTGASWLTKRGTLYVRNPIMAAPNCSGVTVLKMPGVETGLASPLSVLARATPTRISAGRTNLRLETFDPSLASALPTVSVLIPRKKRYATPAKAPVA
mmetsp:Transcript_31356/g.66756  ORF Transcript_31356/g.66756 Transcript_31356/m.66756 type:complete len:300 (-) Transcript_31356:853-1752(-)